MQVGICPRMASQGNNPGCAPKLKQAVLRLQAAQAANEPVDLGLGLGVPPVRCHSTS